MKRFAVEPIPWRPFFAEMAGTALLLMIGLSIVTLMFGVGSPMVDYIPNVNLRKVITGFLFGSTGALISISHLGKISGSHLNPAVTMSFWLFKKMDSRKALIYIVAQMSGAVLGALPILLWGQLGRSISFGATAPGEGYSVQTALLGELATSFFFIAMLIIFLGFRQIRPYTPLLSPVYFAIMNPIESHISGLSTNPARSFGPSLVAGIWDGWWIYWVGPFGGALLACIVCSRLAKRITVAKLYHFESEGDRLARRTGSAD